MTDPEKSVCAVTGLPAKYAVFDFIFVASLGTDSDMSDIVL